MGFIFAFVKNLNIFQILTLLSLSINLGGLHYIKVQNTEIENLNTKIAQYVQANEDMSTKITMQNDALKEGEAKYLKAQSALDRAVGGNNALTKEFAKFRDDLGKRPVPVTCPESIKDLKDVVIPLVKEWNSK